LIDVIISMVVDFGFDGLMLIKIMAPSSNGPEGIAAAPHNIAVVNVPILLMNSLQWWM
jgi:hypothetical protein